MAKLSIKPIDPPKPPPRTFILEMNEEEAAIIKALLGKFPGNDNLMYDIYHQLDNAKLPYKSVYYHDTPIEGCIVVK